MNASRSNMTGSYYFADHDDNDVIITLPKLFDDGIQCPFVAEMDMPGVIGCALYPDAGKEDLRFTCFQNYTCKYFSCQSRDKLNEREILFAAKLMGDWYYYTIMIQSIDMLRDLIREYSDPESVPAGVLSGIKSNLDTTLREDENLHSLSSYFT